MDQFAHVTHLCIIVKNDITAGFICNSNCTATVTLNNLDNADTSQGLPQYIVPDRFSFLFTRCNRVMF